MKIHQNGEIIGGIEDNNNDNEIVLDERSNDIGSINYNANQNIAGRNNEQVIRINLMNNRE